VTRRTAAPGPGSGTGTTWLGLDLGGTKVALRSQTQGGGVRERVFRWRGHGVADDLAQLAAAIDELRSELPDGFQAVGVALPATVTADGRVSAWPSRPAWTGLDLRHTLRELFADTPVRWADDGDLGALAEAEDARCDDLLYVGVGTGIGGGLIAGGVPCPGLDRGSFEFGHVVTDPAGPLCRCGRRGCLQATASGPATLQRASRLRGLEVSYDDLCRGVIAEESWAVTAVDLSCHRLAVAITGVQELLHPEQVVIGGGFAAGITGFVDIVAGHNAALARAGGPVAVVRASRLGGLPTLRGATELARLLETGQLPAVFSAD
jgi:kanosamine 6-kinase